MNIQSGTFMSSLKNTSQQKLNIDTDIQSSESTNCPISITEHKQTYFTLNQEHKLPKIYHRDWVN